MKKNLRLNLQFFAQSEGEGPSNDTTSEQNKNDNNSKSITFTQEELDDKLNETKKSVLNDFLTNQGITQEELNEVLKSYKTKKVETNNSNSELNIVKQQLVNAQKLVEQTSVEKEAMLEALKMGVNANTIPYLLKMADLSNVYKNGKTDIEQIKQSLKKVLEDVPQLKDNQQQNNGFQIGSKGKDNQKAQEEQLKTIFGIRK